MRWSVVALCVLLAGCSNAPASDDVRLDGHEGSEERDVEREADHIEASPSPTVAIEPPVDERSADPLQNITEMYWSTDQSFDAVAFELVLGFGKENRCEITSAVSGARGESAPHAAFVLEDERSGIWASSGGGSLVAARVGTLDTETVLGGNGEYMSAIRISATLDGEWTLTRLATGVRPVDWTDRMEGSSMTLDVLCDAPFSVTSAQIGEEADLRHPQSMEDGAAAEAFIVGSAAVNTGFRTEIRAEEGHVRVASAGFHAGTAKLFWPEGSADLLLPLDGFVHQTGGPGTYGVDLTRVAVYAEVFCTMVYGLDADMDLAAGLSDKRIFEF